VRRTIAVLTFSTTVLMGDLGAQTCVSYLVTAQTSAASVNVMNTSLNSAIVSAATMWNNCDSGVPAVVANGTGTINVTVTHHAGPSTRTDGACGQGVPAVENGQITGGSITIWDSWGPGSTLSGTDCSAHFSALIAHELGHVFGLKNGTCSGYLMGPSWQTVTAPHSAECTAVDSTWTTSSESGGGGGGDGGEGDDDCGEWGCSPLVADLNGDGIRTTSVATNPVQFDIDGDGRVESMGWTDPATEEGFLWLDLHPNHRVDDGRELFGIGTILPDGTRARDGFEALRMYDQVLAGGNADGQLDVGDAIWGRLRIWVDENHDGRSQPTETGPIHRYGVVSISLNYIIDNTPDVMGNIQRFRGRYLRRSVGNGVRYEELALHDVFFAAR